VSACPERSQRAQPNGLGCANSLGKDRLVPVFDLVNDDHHWTVTQGLTNLRYGGITLDLPQGVLGSELLKDGFPQVVVVNPRRVEHNHDEVVGCGQRLIVSVTPQPLSRQVGMSQRVIQG
jgi:hypothetical protein